MLKSAIACVTWRCSRLLSFLSSCASLRVSRSRESGSSTALMGKGSSKGRRFGQAEHLAADGVAIGVHVGLLGGHAGRLHARMRQHQAQYVVAQRLLQVNVALLDAQRDGAA